MNPGPLPVRSALLIARTPPPPPSPQLPPPSIAVEDRENERFRLYIDIEGGIYTFDRRIQWRSVESLLRTCAETSGVTRVKPQLLFKGGVVALDVHPMQLVLQYNGYNLFEYVGDDGW